MNNREPSWWNLLWIIPSVIVTGSAYIAAQSITEAYLKVSGAWQPLIGSVISDVGGVTA